MMKHVLTGAVALSLVFVGAAYAADTPDIDVRGIALHATPKAAEEAVKTHLENATFQENDGTFTLGTFTSPPLVFGATIVDKDNLANFATQLIYDLRSPQKVIAIARNQNFIKTTDMPRTTDLLSGLIDKYGKPTTMLKGDINTIYRLEWIIGASPTVAKDSACGHDMALVAQTAASHNTDINLLGGAKCGVWVQAQFGISRENPDLVQWFNIGVADFPSLAASNAYIAQAMKDGLAANQKAQSNQAAKPKL